MHAAKVSASTGVEDTSKYFEEDVPESERVKKPPAMKVLTKKQKLDEAREKAKSWHAKRKSLPANAQVLAKAEEEDEEGTNDEEDTMDEGDYPTISEPVVNPLLSGEENPRANPGVRTREKLRTNSVTRSPVIRLCIFSIHDGSKNPRPGSPFLPFIHGYRGCFGTLRLYLRQ